MFHLAFDLIKAIRRLVSSDCANYSRSLNDITNYCCLEKTEGCVCMYFIQNEGNPRCGYFEKCVLPMDPMIHMEYVKNKEEYDGKT